MITWDIERIVCGVVESFLPTSSDPKLGLLITLEFQVNTRTDEDNFYSTRILELLFNRPSNYTKVFSRVLTNRGEVLVDWKNTSNHDSCWLSDGLKDIFNIYMEVRNEMDELNPSSKSDPNREVSITKGVFHKFARFVEIDMIKDGDYHYKLISVKDKN